MTQSNERIIRHKLGLLNLAEELGNMARACRVMGVCRDTYLRPGGCGRRGYCRRLRAGGG
mgnify:CR=1 FL=1